MSKLNHYLETEVSPSIEIEDKKLPFNEKMESLIGYSTRHQSKRIYRWVKFGLITEEELFKILKTLISS